MYIYHVYTEQSLSKANALRSMNLTFVQVGLYLCKKCFTFVINSWWFWNGNKLYANCCMLFWIQFFICGSWSMHFSALLRLISLYRKIPLLHMCTTATHNHSHHSLILTFHEPLFFPLVNTNTNITCQTLLCNSSVFHSKLFFIYLSVVTMFEHGCLPHMQASI